MSEAVGGVRKRQGASSLRWALAALNLLGGLAVLASYSLMFERDDASAILWGGVPQRLRALYTTNMWLAALGYFPFTALFLFGCDPARVRFLGGRYGYGLLFVLYAVVLVGSAIWMPLTFAWADSGAFPFWLIRVDLALVGLGSLGLLACVATIAPRPPTWLHFLAVFGCVAFCFQTAVLDGTIWPAYYTQP
jgi:hypothetical protein